MGQNSIPGQPDVSEQQSIDISVDQLLELRHIPVPPARKTPASNGGLPGAFASHRRGHGTDFDDLRSYSPGDDMRHIDWRASARTDELHTRLYREEKEHRSSIICDLRHCMFTGSSILRANQAVFLSARLLWRACQTKTRVTLIVVTADGLSMIAPGTGDVTAIRGCNLLASEHKRIAQELTRQYGRPRKLRTSNKPASRQSTTDRDNDIAIVDAQYQRHALKVDSRDHGPTLDTVLRWLVLRREQKTTQLWVSGFDYVGEAFFDTLGAIARQSLNVAIHIDDPILNIALPAGKFHYRSQSANNDKTYSRDRITWVGKSNQDLLTERLIQKSQTRAKRFDALAIPLLSTAHGNDNVLSALRNQAYLA